MDGNKRPLSVTILGCVYILVGSVGFVRHFSDPYSWDPTRFDGLWIELFEVVAALSGVFMLPGRNWSAMAWIGFQVVVGSLHSLERFVIHSLFLVLIAWGLFGRPASQYFRANPIEPARR